MTNNVYRVETQARDYHIMGHRDDLTKKELLELSKEVDLAFTEVLKVKISNMKVRCISMIRLKTKLLG